MESTVDYEKRDLFVSRVQQLISIMQEWVKDTGLITRVCNSTIEETTPGKYTVEMLELNNSEGKLVAKVIPVGAYVIAAEGRVDIKGYLGKESVVFLKKGESSIVKKVGKESKDNLLHYAGFKTAIISEGWFWIEDKHRRIAHLLDRKLFLELITMVSDYEFR